MLVIDRFEGDYAIVETGSGMVNIPKTEIPKECREGDILLIRVDKTGTDARKKKIESLMDDLFRDE